VGHRPQKRAQFPGAGACHALGGAAACQQVARAWAQPHLRLPADIPEGCGPRFQTPWEMTADWRRVTGGPGPADQGPARVRMAGLGKCSSAPMGARGVRRRCQAERAQRLAGLGDACEGPECGPERDRHGNLAAAGGLERRDHGTAAPGVHRLVGVLRKRPEPRAGCRHRPPICWGDGVLSGRGTAPLTAPASVGGAPGRAAGIADVVPEQNGFEALRGGRERAQRRCTGSTQSPEGSALDRRDMDRREVTRAPEAGPWDGVTTVGLHPSARLRREARWGHAPAEVAVLREIAGEPRPPWPRFRDQDQPRACGSPRAHAPIEVPLTRANGAKGDAFSPVRCGNRGNSTRLLRNSPADVERARRGHG